MRFEASDLASFLLEKVKRGTSVEGDRRRPTGVIRRDRQERQVHTGKARWKAGDSGLVGEGRGPVPKSGATCPTQTSREVPLAVGHRGGLAASASAADFKWALSVVATPSSVAVSHGADAGGGEWAKRVAGQDDTFGRLVF